MAVQAVKKEAPAAPEAAPAAQRKKGGKLKLIIILLVLLGGGGAGAYWFMNHEQGPQEAKLAPEKPPLFQVLDNFTVNLQVEEASQFLQAGITLRVADNAAQDAIKARMPEVRNSILLLLSSRKPAEILTVEGKHKLAADIGIAVNGIYDPSLLKAKPTPKPAPQESAATSPPAEGAAPEQTAEAAPEGGSEAKTKVPVLGVLFTSFIVQ